MCERFKREGSGVCNRENDVLRSTQKPTAVHTNQGAPMVLKLVMKKHCMSR